MHSDPLTTIWRPEAWLSEALASFWVRFLLHKGMKRMCLGGKRRLAFPMAFQVSPEAQSGAGRDARWLTLPRRQEITARILCCLEGGAGMRVCPGNIDGRR